MTLPTPQDLLDASLAGCDLTDLYPSGMTDEQRRRALHELRLIARQHLREMAVPLVPKEDDPAEFGKLSKAVASWKKQVKGYLKNLFVAGALLLTSSPTLTGAPAAAEKPKGKTAEPAPELTDDDLAEIDRQLERQDEYLVAFAGAIDSGDQPRDATLLSRAEQYGSSVWGASWAVILTRVARLGTEMEGRRIHRGVDEPCGPCEEAEAMGWVPVEELVPIGSTPCRGNCHCTYQFRTKRVSMSKLTKKERDKLPEADFGDPERRLFPIMDQDDVNSAAHLIGKAKDPEKVKARIVAIARRKKLTIPDAWDSKATAKMSAAFDLGEGDADADMVVYPDAKLFEAGEYPDKSYEMTPEELWAAAESFSAPVPIDLEHTPTVLDGKLGEVRSVRVDGDELRGAVAIPKWLNSLLEDGKRKVSCEWDRATKTLKKLSIVEHPRIADAALMAAFAQARPDEAEAMFARANRTYHGASTIQSLHDTAARAGALCDPANGAQFTSSRERSAMQQIHDLAVKAGAKCNVMSDRSAAMYSADNPSPSPQGKTRMSLKDRFAALFGGKSKPSAAEAKAAFAELPDDQMAGFLAELAEGAGVTETAAPTPAPATASFADSPEAKAMKTEIEALKRQNRDAEIREKAAAFAEGEIKAERSLPSERPDLIADYTEAATDDAENSRKVSFSGADGKPVTGSRIERLVAKHAKRPKVSALTKEYLTADDLPEGARVLFAAEDPTKEKKPTDERVKVLLDKTHLGRQALKLKSK